MKEKLSLSETIRIAIRSSEKSICKISEESGVSRQQLYRFLDAERDLTLLTVEKLAEVLNLEFAKKGN